MTLLNAFFHKKDIILHYLSVLMFQYTLIENLICDRLYHLKIDLDEKDSLIIMGDIYVY
jgi:hypothetical protein